ncbi:MAG TPA: M17 family peptidase N-terminal domain-containing protein, partial [Bdellovibrionales bacterium]|nr:M17 family peptidase N-terminal domain-containing protein [Bdellovibrionales bacterium]
MKKSNLENLGVDTLVVFTSKRVEGKNGTKKNSTKKASKDAKPGPKAMVEGVSKALEMKILSASEDGAVSGAPNETVLFRDAHLGGARHLLVVGLGDAKSMNHETLRQAMASAINALKGSKMKSVAVAMDSLPHNTIAADLTVQSMTEGALLASYAFTDFKEKKESSSPERLDIVSRLKAKTYDRGIENGIAIAESVNFCRWLGDRPGNRMTPTILAEETVKAAKGSKLKVTVWDRSKIKSEKMGS